MKVIILIGQRVRSGTNFLGSTLSLHPQIQTIPKNRSHSEFNLYRSDAILNFYKEATSKSFGLSFKENDETEFYSKLGEIWLELLSKKYDLEKEKILFLKSPIISHYQLWLKTFPKAKFIFLSRDGRDNVVSSVKASNIKKANNSFYKKGAIYLNNYSGRFFRNHILDWKKTAEIYDSIIEENNITKIKYESLVNSFEGVNDLFKFLEIDSSTQTIKKCLNAPVVGSSFGSNTNKKGSNWDPEHNKSKFVFIKKWSNWSFYKKYIFKKLAGKQLIRLGYEKNTEW